VIIEKCKWCDKELKKEEIGGSECNNCWEMRKRMEEDIPLANKILKSLILQGVQ